MLVAKTGEPLAQTLPDPIHPCRVGKELMHSPGSWAVSGAPGGVFCKPAGAAGWLSSRIKVLIFLGGEKDGNSCLSDVKSIFDVGTSTSMWRWLR